MEIVLGILDFVVSLGLVASLADFFRRHPAGTPTLAIFALGSVSLGWLLQAAARLWNLGPTVRAISLFCLLLGLGGMLLLLLRRIGGAGRWPRGHDR